MKYINTVIISELYNFLFEYYDDITLADYIIDIFSIEKTDVVQSYVAYEKFFRILHYLQSMSGDPQICFKAGVYFSEKSLLKGILIPGIRFSLKKTFRQIDDIIKNIFPDLQTSIESLDSSSLILSIHSSDISIKPSFYFTEYIKGMISIIPDHWSLPLANVEVLAYPFSIEDILGNIDVPYQKKESIFIIYDTEIAEEKLLDDDQSDDNSERKFEILKDDLFVKDIFITKKTLLNSASLKLRVNWSNTNSKKIIPFVVLSFLGIPVLTFIILKGILSIMTALSFFLYYETFIFIVYYILNKKELKKIYTKVEKSLINELSEQKNATGKAISNTINRLESIENIIEISKRIIHEKNIVNLFDNIRKLSAKALNADRTTVFIHDKENRELRSGPDLSDEKKEFRIPEDKGIAGEILRTQKILNVKDAYNNPHFNKAIDRQTGYETKTIIGAPLLDLDENLIGVIQVLNKKEGEFQKIDEHIIEILSSYIAAALRDTLAIKNLQQRGIDPDLLDG
ncbi:MAG: GAF domain-containing protein, partial [Spirochaetota bacterium]|nr:GAF domain-containing protein [Spirochaetota bacterium]